MVNKDPIKISSIVITFVVFLAGSVLCFWIYTNIIQNPKAESDTSQKSIEINTDKLKKVEAIGTPTISIPSDGYGRANPFMPYKWLFSESKTAHCPVIASSTTRIINTDQTRITRNNEKISLNNDEAIFIKEIATSRKKHRLSQWQTRKSKLQYFVMRILHDSFDAIIEADTVYSWATRAVDA